MADANKLILVVDDERLVREFIAAVLRGDGYDVAEASCAEEAFQLARDRAPDAVVTDLRLGGPVAGDEVLRTLFANGLRCGAATIVTADGGFRLPDDLTRRGVRLLRKPFAIAALEEALGLPLRRSRP